MVYLTYGRKEKAYRCCWQEADHIYSNSFSNFTKQLACMKLSCWDWIWRQLSNPSYNKQINFANEIVTFYMQSSINGHYIYSTKGEKMLSCSKHESAKCHRAKWLYKLMIQFINQTNCVHHFTEQSQIWAKWQNIRKPKDKREKPKYQWVRACGRICC